MDQEAVTTGPTPAYPTYEPPKVTPHGTLAEITQAALIGPLVDNNHSQGQLIVNNTSF